MSIPLTGLLLGFGAIVASTIYARRERHGVARALFATGIALVALAGVWSIVSEFRYHSCVAYNRHPATIAPPPGLGVGPGDESARLPILHDCERWPW